MQSVDYVFRRDPRLFNSFTDIFDVVIQNVVPADIFRTFKKIDELGDGSFMEHTTVIPNTPDIEDFSTVRFNLCIDERDGPAYMSVFFLQISMV